MDPGTGTFSISSWMAGIMEIFISKLDVSGNFSWAGSCGGNTQDDVGNAITPDGSGNIYVSGYFNSPSADFDPGTGTFNLSPTADDVYVLKLSSVASAITEYYSNDNGMHLYPSPTTGLLTVIIAPSGGKPAVSLLKDLEVYNLIGEKIYKTEISEAKTELDLSNQPAGIYFIKIGSVTRKIIKQ